MRKHSKSTRYLLRFDDICPTMNWRVWSEIEAALLERNLKPILAVVPDNQDPKLAIDPPAEDFWERAQGWQTRGWTIAMHGYQHKYVTHHAGLVTLKKRSEFAGLPAAEQEEKLRRGVAILKRHGIEPRVWVAPANSFDALTVSLLPRFGISTICDGYCRFPFVYQRSLFWVPQQLFGFRPAPAGVWTVCYHHNGWTDEDLERFRVDLDRYGPAIATLEEIAEEWAGRRSRWSAFLCTSPRLSPALTSWQLKLASFNPPPEPSMRHGMKPLAGISTKLSV